MAAAQGDRLILPLTILLTITPLILAGLPWFWARKLKFPILYVAPWTSVVAVIGMYVMVLNVVSASLNGFTSNCFIWAVFNFIPTHIVTSAVVGKAILLLLQNLFTAELVHIASRGYKATDLASKWWVRNTAKWKSSKYQVKVFFISQLVLLVPFVICVIAFPAIFTSTYFDDACYQASGYLGISSVLALVLAGFMLVYLLWRLRRYEDNFGVKKDAITAASCVGVSAVLYLIMKGAPGVSEASKKNEAFADYMLYAIPAYGFLTTNIWFHIWQSYDRKYRKADDELSFRLSSNHSKLVSKGKTSITSSWIKPDKVIAEDKEVASPRTKSDLDRFQAVPTATSAATSPKAKQVKKTKVNLKHVLNSESGKGFFRDFLLAEFAVENYYFFMEVYKYRKITDAKELLTAANGMVDTYISLDAPYCVNISGPVRKAILDTIKDASTKDVEVSLLANVFAKAQLEVLQTMARDCFPRFKNSPKYRHWFDEMDAKLDEEDNSDKEPESPRTPSPAAKADDLFSTRTELGLSTEILIVEEQKNILSSSL